MTRRLSFTVRSRSDLQSLTRPPAFRSTSIGRIELNLPNLPEADRAAGEQRLNELYHACGCGEGTIGVIVGTLAAAALVSAGAVWWTLGAGAVAGAAAGKVAGVWLSWLRLLAVVADLRRRAPSLTVVSGEECG